MISLNTIFFITSRFNREAVETDLKRICSFCSETNFMLSLYLSLSLLKINMMLFKKNMMLLILHF